MSQKGKIISYFNDKVNEEKLKYYFYVNDFNVIVLALEKWRNYLRPKCMYIDNCALQFESKLNKMHAKWVEFIQKITFFYQINKCFIK